MTRYDFTMRRTQELRVNVDASDVAEAERLAIDLADGTEDGWDLVSGPDVSSMRLTQDTPDPSLSGTKKYVLTHRFPDGTEIRAMADEFDDALERLDAKLISLAKTSDPPIGRSTLFIDRTG